MCIRSCLGSQLEHITPRCILLSQMYHFVWLFLIPAVDSEALSVEDVGYPAKE